MGLAVVGRELLDVMRHYGEKILQSQHRSEDGINRVRVLLGDPQMGEAPIVVQPISKRNGANG